MTLSRHRPPYQQIRNPISNTHMEIAIELLKKRRNLVRTHYFVGFPVMCCLSLDTVAPPALHQTGFRHCGTVCLASHWVQKAEWACLVDEPVPGRFCDPIQREAGDKRQNARGRGAAPTQRNSRRGQRAAT